MAGALVLVACGDDHGTSTPSDPDFLDPTCQGDPITPVCAAPTITEKANVSANHIPDGTPIVYDDVPPSSGDHRPAWGRWGEYSMLPPQRWLHNLEHGGIVFLYDPCAPAATIDALREYARARPDDASGQFRWVLTPYPGLPTTIAVIAWEWTWLGECVDSDAFDAFIDAHYRHGPEDISSDGSFQTNWLGR